VFVDVLYQTIGTYVNESIKEVIVSMDEKLDNEFRSFVVKVNMVRIDELDDQ
jgi:hypothetical protein